MKRDQSLVLVVRKLICKRENHGFEAVWQCQNQAGGKRKRFGDFTPSDAHAEIWARQCLATTERCLFVGGRKDGNQFTDTF